VRTEHRFYGYRPDHVEWSASVVKAMLMVAYLDQRSVAGRPLNGYDRSLLVPMITRSDDNAATAVLAIVGTSGLSRLAARVGMTRFRPVDQPWGTTQITARDQTRFFLHLDSYLPPRHRTYAKHLLASIVPSQRWGVGEVAPRGWKLYFKGGWGSGTGLLDHQVVLLQRGCARASLAVLTMYEGSHGYGKATLRGIFARLLRGFPTGKPLYPVVLWGRYRGTLSGEPQSTITFVASGGGQRVLHLTLAPGPGEGSACPLASAASPFPPISVDPYGHFHTAESSTAAGLTSRLSLTGRFAKGRRAQGSITIEHSGGPAGSCVRTVSWSTRA